MNKNVRLRLCGMLTIRMGALPTDCCICTGLWNVLCDIWMTDGDMLEIRGFLYEFKRLVTVRTFKLEILLVRLLHMIVHSVLFGTNFRAMWALEMTILETNVLGSGCGSRGHICVWRGRGREEGRWGKE